MYVHTHVHVYIYICLCVTLQSKPSWSCWQSQQLNLMPCFQQPTSKLFSLILLPGTPLEELALATEGGYSCTGQSARLWNPLRWGISLPFCRHPAFAEVMDESPQRACTLPCITLSYVPPESWWKNRSVSAADTPKKYPQTSPVRGWFCLVLLSWWELWEVSQQLETINIHAALRIPFPIMIALDLCLLSQDYWIVFKAFLRVDERRGIATCWGCVEGSVVATFTYLDEKKWHLDEHSFFSLLWHFDVNNCLGYLSYDG